MRRFAGVSLVVLLVGAPGCDRTPPPTPASTTPAAAPLAPPSSTEATKAPPSRPAETAAVEQPDDKAVPESAQPAVADVANTRPVSKPHVATEATSTETEAVDTKSAEAAAERLGSGLSKRMLIYTPSGPIVAEFVLRIDGRGAIEMNDAFVDELLKVADTDRDGETKWNEALANQRSGIPQFVGQNGGDIQSFYDRDRDGVVDRSELWNLLGHGEEGLAFRLEHADGPGGATTAGEVARLLDTDGDGALSLAEIDEAPAQLHLADVNDDERLTPDDLGAPTMGMPQPEMNSGAMGNVVTTASMLDEETDWGVIHYELDERYLMHGQFRSERLPLFPEFAKKLDADENGLLSLAEAEILNYLSPQLRMEIDLGAAESSGAGLKVVDLRSDMSSAQQRATERSVQFDWPNLTLAFSVADNANPGDIVAQADATFMQADQDKNGYLEKTELPEPQQASFEGWDVNADGKLYPDELKAALQSERMPLLNRIRAVITPGEHSLLAALDADRNGSLSAREIQESAAKLRAGDRDGDGRLTKDEIPTRIAVHFERGAGAGPAPPVNYAAPAVDAPSNAPTWFQRMDSNSDGDISPREFLGAPETYARLDQDGDGLLSLAEATADTAQADAKQP